MPPPVQINFSIGGVSEVRRAFGDVVSYLERLERSRTRFEQREAIARQRLAEREAEQKKQISTRYASATEFLQRQAAQAEARRGRDRVRGEETTQSQIADVRRRFRSEEERADEQMLRRQLYSRRQFARAIGGATASGLVAGGRRVGGLASATLNMAVGGGFNVAQSVQRSIAASGLAADIANSAWIPNSADPSVRTKRNPNDILGAARATGIQFGMTQEDTLGGLQKFVAKTGRLDEGLKVMKDLAELARATGSSFEDIADAAGDVSNELGGNKPDAVLGVMRGIAGQGKVGAVEIRNLATGMAKLAASAGQFSGDAAQNMLLMGMLAQEARGGGGAASATMAATSVTGFVNTLKTPARVRQFTAHGVQVFGKDKMIRDPRQIILESLQATKGDPIELKKMFMNIMGERAITGYANIFRRAEVAKPGTGKAAVTAEFDRMLGGTAMTQADVKRAAADRMQQEDAKIAQALADFDRAIATELVPELMKLIPVVRETTPAFVTILKTGVPAFADLITTVAKFAEANQGLIKSIAEHPIGAIMAAEVIKSIAAAGIGQGVRAVLLGLIGGGGGGGLSGAAGAAGKALPALGLVGATTAVAIAANDYLQGKGAEENASNKSAIGKSNAGVNIASDLFAKARAGTVSADDIASARGAAGSLGALRDEQQKRVAGGSYDIFTSGMLGMGDKQKNAEAELRNTEKALQLLQGAIQASATALRSHATTAANPTSAIRNGGPMSSNLRGGPTH